MARCRASAAGLLPCSQRSSTRGAEGRTSGKPSEQARSPGRSVASEPAGYRAATAPALRSGRGRQPPPSRAVHRGARDACGSRAGIVRRHSPRRAQRSNCTRQSSVEQAVNLEFAACPQSCPDESDTAYSIQRSCTSGRVRALACAGDYRVACHRLRLTANPRASLDRLGCFNREHGGGGCCV